MPHLILEYSANVAPPKNISAFLNAIHHVVAETGGIRIENCKSRAVRRDDFAVGTGKSDSGFVHLDVALIEGRSEPVIQALGRELLKLLLESFKIALYPRLQATVEVRDIRRGAYFKFPEETQSC